MTFAEARPEALPNCTVAPARNPLPSMESVSPLPAGALAGVSVVSVSCSSPVLATLNVLVEVPPGSIVPVTSSGV